jgi:signal transduction histidine kinase
VLLLALAAFFFLWRWTVQKKRLAERQKELAERQIKQLEQEKQLIATQAILDGEVQERTRLARDLHDGLGSILAAARYNLIDIRKALVMESAEAERFDRSVSLLDDSMHEMRRVAHHLMPESLGNAGLKQSITDFCNSVPIVKFSYYGDDSRLDPQLEVMIYRIMHELVSNALKHSGASHILVEVVQDADRIFLTVQDNGCGFDASAKSQGMGLANIRNRVAACNGNVDIHSVAGEGTEINVEIQLKIKN